MTYFVYENFGGAGRARVHMASCHYCNSGQGLHGGAMCEFGKWHGPLGNRSEAIALAKSIAADARVCGKCLRAAVSTSVPSGLR